MGDYARAVASCAAERSDQPAKENTGSGLKTRELFTQLYSPGG
ncbi:hypothetical protein SynBIOSU31_02027 [Synechococcus sp. BIOS-U3-1]|nr:hypothetical protein SynBIOSU31_02027 [Synechococcus sp. BIOS-U3-1]